MKMKCAVYNCPNTRRDTKDNKMTFFSFPKNEKHLKKWLSFCRREKSSKCKYWIICMEHFKTEDITGYVQFEMGLCSKRTLMPGAIPCINKNEVVSETMQQRAERIRKRNNKQMVETLLKESYAATEQISVSSESTSNSNASIDQTAESLHSTPNNAASETLTIECIDEPVAESPQCSPPQSNFEAIGNYVDTLEVDIADFQKHIETLQRQNTNLKYQLLQAEEKYANEVDTLKSYLNHKQFEMANIDAKLSEIFSTEQIYRLKNDIKSGIWSDEDMQTSEKLYSTSASAYLLLRKKDFPLPAVRTLEYWMQKQKSSYAQTQLPENMENFSMKS